MNPSPPRGRVAKPLLEAIRTENVPSLPNCECQRLSDVLVQYEDQACELPNHTCPGLRLSCAWWALTAVGPLEDVLAAAPYLRWEELKWSLRLADGHFAEITDLQAWPYATNSHSDLFAVIRKSLEERPQQKATALVEHLPEWAGLLKHLLSVTKKLPGRKNGTLEKWDLQHHWLGLDRVRHELANYHLPPTIGTARYALWCISPKKARPAQPPSWPTRGIFVTTYCLGAALGVRHRKLPLTWNPGEVLFSIEGSPRWMTAKLWHHVGEVLAEHRRWWQDRTHFGSLPLPSLRRANRGSSARDTDWREDVVQVLSGVIDAGEAVRREMEREAEKQGKPARLLGPMVRRVVEKRVGERLRREEQKRRHV